MKKFKTTLLMGSFTAAIFLMGAAIEPALAAGAHSGGHDKKSSAPGSHGGDGHGPSSKMSGGHGHSGASAIGGPGKASEATRTITITMLDNSYKPESISVKKGEVVRFKIKNAGEAVHEFNIGTASMHAHHQKEMEMMVEHGILEFDKIHHDKMKMDMGGGKTMEHNDPNSVLLEPGKSAEVTWKFSTESKLEFACNVPGHYDSGMMGKIKISH